MIAAPTAQRLADTLRQAGFELLAKRAEANEFHDFLSPHTFPELELDKALVKLIQTRDGVEREAATNIRARLHDGDFDASLAESDDWAASADGKAAFAELVRK